VKKSYDVFTGDQICAYNYDRGTKQHQNGTDYEGVLHQLNAQQGSIINPTYVYKW
jgi:hypothetical protein